MPRMFRTSDKLKHANRCGRYGGRIAKIQGRPAHIVVAERQNVRNPDINPENSDA